MHMMEFSGFFFFKAIMSKLGFADAWKTLLIPCLLARVWKAKYFLN